MQVAQFKAGLQAVQIPVAFNPFLVRQDLAFPTTEHSFVPSPESQAKQASLVLLSKKPSLHVSHLPAAEHFAQFEIH